MLKRTISCLSRGLSGLDSTIKGSMTEVSTHVVSFLSLQAMRFSLQTTLKLMLLMFFPNLAFAVQPLILSTNI